MRWNCIVLSLWMAAGPVAASPRDTVADAVDNAAKGPLEVFILAGQSNMVGAAKISTFDYIGEDPKTLPMLQEMRGKDGKPRKIADTWISYYQSHEPGDPQGEGFGQLIAGYGGRKDPTEPGDNIGPELTFGIYVQKALRRPVLIIKTAWGGKSLYQDFRPPSAGSFELSAAEIEKIQKSGGDLEKERAARKERSGAYYRLMLGHVRHVLADIRRIYPEYDEKQGYVLSGFVWFQGWNDMVNRSVYPRRAEKGGYDEYSRLLTLFIKDVRKDLGAPRLPFVIGVMGIDGPMENHEKRYRPIHQNFWDAMAAPAARPEFQGNVVAVQTAPFWDMPLDGILKKRSRYNGKKRTIEKRVKKGELSEEQAKVELGKIRADAITPEEAAQLKRGASNAAYHYLGCAKTMALIGKAFAEAVVALRAESSG